MKCEKIGLAFPEVLEHHHSSYKWGKNKSIAIKLAYEANIDTKNLDQPFSFPAGNMFWVQPKYLHKFTSLKISDSSFPPEPIAIDGTVAHAIERMLPHLVEAAGGKIAVIAPTNALLFKNELQFFSNTILNPEEVESIVVHAIQNSKPLAVTRYFDGEGAFFKAKNWTKKYCEERMNYYFGQDDYEIQNAIDICKTIIDSMENSDVIGIPNTDIVRQIVRFTELYCDGDVEKLPGLKRRLSKQIDCTSAWRIISAFQLVCSSLSSGARYATKDIHYDLVRSGGLYRIIDMAKDVRLVTSQEVEPFLKLIFGNKFTCYEIPGRALDMDPSISTKHYPHHNRLMRKKLQSIDFKGSLVLVGAGPLGKEYCSIVKARGGISIDIGAVFDSWINFLTRPEHSNGSGDIASELILTSFNVRKLTGFMVEPKSDVRTEDLPKFKENHYVAKNIN
jgi:hypothetical protein